MNYIEGKLFLFLCGREYFTFLFELGKDRDLIFQIIPCFIDPQNVFESIVFRLGSKVDVPSAISIIWVCLPHHSLHYLNDESLKSILNAPPKYIDRSEPQTSMFAYVKICVEGDLSVDK